MNGTRQARPPEQPSQQWAFRVRRLLAMGLPATSLVVVLVAAWQLVAAHNHYLIPGLPAVWDDLVHHPREYGDAAANTLRESGAGLGASFVLGFSLAVVMTSVPVVERAVMPVAIALNVTPVLAIAPGLASAFGLSSTLPRYIVTGLIVFFPILINSLVGLRSADPEAVQYFTTLHASRRDVLFHLRLPSSLPYLFAAARICLPLSVVGAVVAELTTGSSPTGDGLGSLIGTASAQVDLAPVYAAIACLTAIGLIFTVAVLALEKKALAWYPSRTGRR